MARICHRCVADWKDRREILNMESRHPKAEVGDAKGCGLSFHHFFFSLSLSLSFFWFLSCGAIAARADSRLSLGVNLQCLAS
jgi:hypothetical protein